MNQYALIFELKALHVKQEKLFETIRLHDQYKDEGMSNWLNKELASTQEKYTQLKNKIYNGKDQN
jgi:hypothetical protein